MATITEKSRTKEIIDRLQAIINNASPVPLASGKVSIYKDEVQSLLEELKSQMDMELKTYREVNDRKGKIINEAKKEAERIIYQAEHTASRMRVTKRTTNVAPLDYNMLAEEERSALDNANQIYAASLIYTDEMLTEVTDMISDAYQNIRNDYEIILQVLEEKLSTISNNREELMIGLQEMETEDRGQQILEIGQLLSNELYNARMKARMDSDEYEDGSVQLSLDLQEEQEEKARQAEEEAQRTAQALAQMTAERDALMATVEKMKREGMSATMRGTRPAQYVDTGIVQKAFDLEKQQTSIERLTEKQEADEEYETGYVTEEELEDGEEYEIEYVTEEELEDGEEYEIEYVDEEELEDEEEYEIEYVDEEELEYEEEYEIEYVNEEELEDGEEYEVEYVDEEGLDKEQEYETGHADKTVSENTVLAEEKVKVQEESTAELQEKKDIEEKSDRKSEEVKKAVKEAEGLPVIPHFRKSGTASDVSSNKEKDNGAAGTAEEKNGGLIRRAVMQKEKAEAAVTVEDTTLADVTGQEKITESKREKDTAVKKKDEDIKTDANGNEYVQATMKFDEEFEIMEF